MKPESLYVHVPFCVRRCGYCDFAVTAMRTAPVSAWLDSVRGELERIAADEGWSSPLSLRTLYVGGGTPSLLGPGAMGRLREALAGLAEPAAEYEWTAEANPESMDAGLAADWRAAGVNRVSLGVQTFHEPTLRWMGRLHGAAGAVAAVDAVKRAGLENVSVDLIFGLPEHLERSWRSDLDRAVALEPAHVSLYGLTAESGTPLGRRVAAGRESLAGEEQYEEEYLVAVDRLTAAGYEPYEVSNFARPGRESAHNRAYWEGRSWIGLGPGSHSYVAPRRWWNTRDWAAYRSRLAAGEPVREGEEVVEGEEALLEWAWLGLRTSAGIRTADLTAVQRELVRGWRAMGWADQGSDRLRLTARGWLLLDRLAVELATAGKGSGASREVAAPRAELA